MSIAKFCEHAGGPAEKAGEIVRMENGISIAQWFKYCVGVGAFGTDTKWDWPEWVCMDYSPEGYRLKSLLTRNCSMEKIGLFSGYEKITGPINGTVNSNDLHSEGRGFTIAEKLANKRDETYYKKRADIHAAFTQNYALLQNSEINRVLAKNHTVDAMNLAGQVEAHISQQTWEEITREIIWHIIVQTFWRETWMPRFRIQLQVLQEF